MRRFLLVIGATVALLGVGEIFARTVLGLGTPPLSTSHPTIEYMFKPDQDLMRLGNRQVYNEFGMRSGPLPDPGATEIILVIGESVINGGNLTDQADLATSIATRQDPDRFYANINAGSWGPGNQLAYLEEFGAFEANTAILVLNTGDLEDLPEFGPIDPATQPREAPWSALSEGVVRYLPRYLPHPLADWVRPDLLPAPFPKPEGFSKGSDYLVGLFALLAKSEISVCVLLHRTLNEYETISIQRRPTIQSMSGEAGIPIVETLPAFATEGRDPKRFFRDNIHLSAEGQSELAGLLQQCREVAAVPYGTLEQ